MAAQIIHASGINWIGISPILALLIGAGSLIVTLQVRRENRQDARSEDVKNEITTSVDHLSEVLLAKLETKETVARISERLARLEGASRANSPDN